LNSGSRYAEAEGQSGECVFHDEWLTSGERKRLVEGYLLLDSWAAWGCADICGQDLPLYTY
jgi:hypothetical protein